MKRALAILFCAVLTGLSWGPGVSRALAGIAVKAAVPKTGGIGSAAGAAANFKNISVAGHGTNFPGVSLRSPLQPVGSAALIFKPVSIVLPSSAFVSEEKAAAAASPAVESIATQKSVQSFRESFGRGFKIEPGGRGQDGSKSEESSISQEHSRGRIRFDGAEAFDGPAETDPVPTETASISVLRSGLQRPNFVADENGPKKGNLFGRRFTGLSPPVLEGTRDLSGYRPPAGIQRARSVQLALHYGLIVASLAATVFAFGPAAALLAAGLIAADLKWQAGVLLKNDGASGFTTTMMGDEAKAYRGYIVETIAMLWRRLGLSEESMPSVRITNSFQSNNAGVEGDGFRPGARFIVGEGYAHFAPEETTAVMAHELGHLFYEDHGVLRHLRNAQGLYAGIEAASKLTVTSALVAGAMLLWSPAVVAVVALAAAGTVMIVLKKKEGLRLSYFLLRKRVWDAQRGLSKAWGDWAQAIFGLKKRPSLWSFESVAVAASAAAFFALWPLGLWPLPAAETFAALLAFPLVLAGLLSGIAVSRQEEYRADHFGAWLANPEWSAADMRRRAAREGRLKGWALLKRNLLANHPRNEARARRLEKSK